MPVIHSLDNKHDLKTDGIFSIASFVKDNNIYNGYLMSLMLFLVAVLGLSAAFLINCPQLAFAALTYSNIPWHIKLTAAWSMTSP